MQVQVNYQNIDRSPWIDQLIEKKLDKLSRYLANSASIQVHLKLENANYHTTLVIHNALHDYAYNCDAENLYESFSSAIDKASRSLKEHKQMVKNRIHRKLVA